MKTVIEKLLPQAIKLDGKGKYTRLFSTKSGNAFAFRSGHVILQNRQNIGEHNTGDAEEIIIVLNGKGVLSIDGKDVITFEKETAIYIPPYTLHDIKNTHRKPLHYVYITCCTGRSQS